MTDPRRRLQALDKAAYLLSCSARAGDEPALVDSAAENLRALIDDAKDALPHSERRRFEEILALSCAEADAPDFFPIDAFASGMGQAIHKVLDGAPKCLAKILAADPASCDGVWIFSGRRNELSPLAFAVSKARASSADPAADARAFERDGSIVDILLASGASVSDAESDLGTSLPIAAAQAENRGAFAALTRFGLSVDGAAPIHDPSLAWGSGDDWSLCAFLWSRGWTQEASELLSKTHSPLVLVQADAACDLGWLSLDGYAQAAEAIEIAQSLNEPANPAPAFRI